MTSDKTEGILLLQSQGLEVFGCARYDLKDRPSFLSNPNSTFNVYTISFRSRYKMIFNDDFFF